MRYWHTADCGRIDLFLRSQTRRSACVQVGGLRRENPSHPRFHVARAFDNAKNAGEYSSRARCGNSPRNSRRDAARVRIHTFVTEWKAGRFTQPGRAHRASGALSLCGVQKGRKGARRKRPRIPKYCRMAGMVRFSERACDARRFGGFATSGEVAFASLERAHDAGLLHQVSAGRRDSSGRKNGRTVPEIRRGSKLRQRQNVQLDTYRSGSTKREFVARTKHHEFIVQFIAQFIAQNSPTPAQTP